MVVKKILCIFASSKTKVLGDFRKIRAAGEYVLTPLPKYATNCHGKDLMRLKKKRIQNSIRTISAKYWLRF